LFSWRSAGLGDENVQSAIRKHVFDGDAIGLAQTVGAVLSLKMVLGLVGAATAGAPVIS